MPQGWLQMKFAEDSTNGYDSNGIDRAVAVAAAARAIVSLRNKPDIPVHRKIREGPPEPATSQIGRKSEGKKVISILEPGESSIRRTTSSIPRATNVPEIVSVDEDEDEDEDEDDDAAMIKSVRPTPSMRRASPSARLDDKITSGSGVATKDINIPPRSYSVNDPSTKRAPSFLEDHDPPTERIPSVAERQLNTVEETVRKTKSKAIPEAEVLTPKPEIEGSTPGPFKLDLPPPASMNRQGSTLAADTEKPKAGTWERTELDRIQKKYDELNNKINSWEKRKKARARRRLDKTESELERTRLKATNKYRTETSDVNNMAAAARAQAAERQLNEELKLKAKTNTILITGKVPTSACSCF